MAKYIVSGLIGRKTEFRIEVEAKTERHARSLALSRIGSARRAKASAIEIEGTKRGD